MEKGKDKEVAKAEYVELVLTLLPEEIKKDENPSISSFQEYAQEYSINKLQELLQEGDTNENINR